MYGLADTAVKVARSSASLAGKRVVVVGGTNGLGRAIALQAATDGAAVTVVGRTFLDEGVKGVSFVKADFSLTSSAASVARALPAESIDVLFMSTGIVPGNKRVATAEGIEIDMAVSALSRLVILEHVAKRLPASARVFVMGFPGSKGYIAKTTIDDVNSTKSYAGGFESPHMNTVALNEALVLAWAKKLNIYGLNPGLIPTGIRNSLHGGGFVGGFLESCIGLFNISPAVYAAGIVPLFTATGFASGTMFGQQGTPILPSPELANDPALVQRWMTECTNLVPAGALPEASGGKK
jgi:NAD(P)-dependent dehydrogenase (short-subunit alcohol dehydrogenase family)